MRTADAVPGPGTKGRTKKELGEMFVGGDGEKMGRRTERRS